jgi:transcriptional antiterminator RfaH
MTVESQLAPGRRVRIRHGALAGLEGTVLKRRDETRLVVSVDFIQQGASIQIDDSQLEAI